MDNYTSIKKIHMYGYKHQHVGSFSHGAFCRVVPKIAPSCVEKLQYQRCIFGIQLTCMVAIDFLSLGPCLSGRKNSTERHFSSLFVLCITLKFACFHWSFFCKILGPISTISTCGNKKSV